MKWPGRSTRSPIGIDVGEHQIKAVQLQGAGGSWQIAACASVPRVQDQTPIGLEELSRFVGLLDRQGFVGRTAVLAVPDSLLVGGILELPPRASGAPLEKITQMELARMHKLQPDSFKIAIWDLPATIRETETTHIMATACGHADADKLLDLFEQVGLNVLALDTAAWSMARACRPMIKQDASVTGILDLGWRSARLVVLYEGVMIYERTIRKGGVRCLHEALIDRTGLEAKVVDHLIRERGLAASGQTDARLVAHLSRIAQPYADQIAQELRMSFSYASHRYGDTCTKRVILAGGGATIPGLSRYLKDVADVALSPAILAELVPCPPQLAGYGDTTALTVALGLAQHSKEATS